MPREVKVGLLVLFAVVVLAAGIFLIGEKNNLFQRKNHYYICFEHVGGLTAGNPVQLNGVTVGHVDSIVLPRQIGDKLLRVHVSIDRRYSERLRTDSLARIKTLGLLGDKYVEISSGSMNAEVIPADGEIPAAQPTNVGELLATGEDVVEDIVAVMASLRNILTRVEQGEGLVGELVTDSEAGVETRATARAALNSFQRILARLEHGEGTAGRLLTDETLGLRLEQAVGEIEALAADLHRGEGLVPLLLNDPEGRRKLETVLDNLVQASEDLATVTHQLEQGEGLLPRLLNDAEMGEELGSELETLLRNLSTVSEKLNQGDGTLGSLINDPQVYEAINDILVGVDESKLLRWLIRNRQKKGIKERYRREQASSPEAGGSAPEVP